MNGFTLITGRKKIKEGFFPLIPPWFAVQRRNVFHIFPDRTIDRKSHTPNTVAMT